MLDIIKYVTSSDRVFYMTLALIIVSGWSVSSIVGSFKRKIIIGKINEGGK